MHDARELPAEESVVARLLRAAGPRPDVPQQRYQRAHAAALAHWEQTLRARRRLRVLCASALAAAATLLAVSFALWPQRPVAPLQLAGTLLRRVGSVELTQPGAGPAHDPALYAGAQLRTATAAGAAFALARHVVRVDEDSVVRIEGPDALALERGRIYVVSTRPHATLRVHTASGTVRDAGTRFEVSLRGATLRVRVREGRVQVDPAGAAPMTTAVAGSALAVEPGGIVTRSAQSTYGSDWQWTLALAEPFDIEGRHLREFLDWVTAEQGWTLAFDAPALQSAATSLVLHGSVAGMDIEDALASVLLGAGLAYEVRAGVLHIGARP